MSEDYDDEENQNVIVDCDILEAAKENIQPLAGGRRVTALASVLATPHGLRDPRLEATKAKLRERAHEAQKRVDKLRALKDSEENDTEDVKGNDGREEGDDDEFTLEEAEENLLDAYVRLVTWTVEHYPQGQSAQSGILELLEEATRVMRHSEYAKVDARYLNLWIRYASYVDHPEVIYEFLLANEIGTKWTKLYEEYAALLEKINRRPKADEIYLLGIARKAEPLEHLERRHRDFQKRMMVFISAVGSDSAAPESNASLAPINPEPRRRDLADTTSTSTLSSVATPLTSASSTFDVFSIPSSSSSLASVGSEARPRANAKIPVFIDPTGEAESAPGNAWPELGTRAERVKENRRVPEKMQGAVLKQRGAAKEATKEAAARARSAPKFVPYRDPEVPAPTASSSKAKIEVFKDPEPPAPTPSSKFVPYRDPEPEPASNVSKPQAKITVFRDPGPPSAPSDSKKSNVAPLNDLAPAPRRSSRLNPKRAAKEESESPAVATEEGPTEAKETKPVASARFVPYKDEDAGQASTATSSAPETVMRPKVLGGGGLGVSKVTSEAEALRKNPFKNYKDL